MVMQEGSDTPRNGPLSGAHVITDADLAQLEQDLRAQYNDTLAGLLRAGRSLLHSSEPGIALLIAHAGRELSNGVRRHLQVEEGITATVDEPGDENEKSSHRELLAAVLGLHHDHELVRRWSRAFDSLVRIVHYNGSTPSHALAAEGFRDLAGVIFSLVGHFGTMKRELQALADVDAPSDQAVERAVHLLMRAQQRGIFYPRLQSPRWLRPLVQRGQFRAPPDRIVRGDTWWMGPWPERDYLIRMASTIPEDVRDVFLHIPLSNTNPRVWSAAAEAARRMPPVVAAPLALHIANAIPNVPPLLVARQAMQLAIELSSFEPASAFSLLKALLQFTRFDQAFPQKEEPDPLNGLRRGTSWMLKSIERSDLDDIALRVIPAVAAVRPVEVVELLISQLRFAMIQMRRMDTGSKREDHSSHHWCENLEWRKNALDSGDLRAILATTLWRVLSTHCTKTPELSARAAGMLGGFSDDLVIRLRAKFLAHTPFAGAADIDALLGDPAMLTFHGGHLEIGEFLAKCFHRASHTARANFAMRIEEGPTLEETLSMVSIERFWAARSAGQDEYEVPATLEETEEAERIRAKRNWQANRLALFGDDVPIELLPLADSLRAAGVIASLDTAPDEEDSPSSDEPAGLQVMTGTELLGSLADKSDDEIARACVVASLTEGASSRSEMATLREGIREVVNSMPERTGSLLTSLIRAGADPTLVAVVAEALLTLARQKQGLPWQGILSAGGELLDSVSRGVAGDSDVDLPAGSPFDEPTGSDAWRGVLDSYLQAVSTAIRARSIPIEFTADLAILLDRIVEFWVTNQHKPSSITTYPEKRRLSIGETLADVVVDMVALASYWLYQTREDGAHADVYPSSELAIGERIDRLLASHEPHLTAVIEAIGDVLPFLVLAEGAWIVRNHDVLFADQRLEAMLQSTVVRFPYYRTIFEFLRPDLVRLSSLLKRNKRKLRAEKADKASVLEGLVSRVRDAWLDSRANSDDADGLAALVFELASTKGKNRAYWGIFRGWTDASEPVSPQAVERCLSLWRWRLEVLERMKPSEVRASEASELLWFLSTPYLPTEDVLPLAMRTVRLSPIQIPPQSRLEEIISANPVGAYDLFALMAKNSLSNRSPFLEVNEVSRAFRFVLNGDDDVRREEARVLLDQLGRRVDHAFSDLETLD